MRIRVVRMRERREEQARTRAHRQRRPVMLGHVIPVEAALLGERRDAAAARRGPPRASSAPDRSNRRCRTRATCPTPVPTPSSIDRCYSPHRLRRFAAVRRPTGSPPQTRRLTARARPRRGVGEPVDRQRDLGGAGHAEVRERLPDPGFEADVVGAERGEPVLVGDVVAGEEHRVRARVLPEVLERLALRRAAGRRTRASSCRRGRPRRRRRARRRPPGARRGVRCASPPRSRAGCEGRSRPACARARRRHGVPRRAEDLAERVEAVLLPRLDGGRTSCRRRAGSRRRASRRAERRPEVRRDALEILERAAGHECEAGARHRAEPQDRGARLRERAGRGRSSTSGASVPSKSSATRMRGFRASSRSAPVSGSGIRAYRGGVSMSIALRTSDFALSDVGSDCPRA